MQGEFILKKKKFLRKDRKRQGKGGRAKLKPPEQGTGTSVHANKGKSHCTQEEEGRLGSQVEAKAGSRSENTKKHGGEDVRSGNPCFNSYLPLH
jgi:hypothetical protein